ncbi:hypothetical protein P872_11805 [Rhodonellum psychrophilum GCM71 = DSM 17998]|uniref:Glycosyltransferase 2-like domain-containing protein n=2 Tax=Rhodonellum TaxID=336827 RepID=U5BKJ8_9BACT|nr:MULTISPECIES: glycosyltransferase [Rhodonellum]ERM80985.1 hypothetical protein P872_11805 [Rhodonellum psychrophilum GCM71 = DSM 17998]SDZ55271.1 Glycosyltransferase involved in cell wall bisynthesis [Rhodonellum ikkaensis]
MTFCKVLGISVVVCTFNGLSRLSNCLSSIISQKFAPEFELIVVENSSTDGTGEFANDFLSRNFQSGNWKLVTEPKAGLLYARLTGLKSAHFEWVLFCDDDNVLFPDFLANCAHFLSQNSQIGVLGSQGIPEFLGAKPEWFDRYSSSFAVGSQLGSSTPQKRLEFVYGACSVYLKQPLLTLFQDGFSPILSDRTGADLISGGDVEWCALMQLLGYKIAYFEDLKFYHQLPASRLTWEYYLRLKRGISGSAGFLFPYEFYFVKSFRSMGMFIIHYCVEEFKSWLLYLKYSIRWNGNPQGQEEQLAFTILEARMKAFFHQRKTAIVHFKQLKQHFGS